MKNNNHKILALKYRPRNFKELIGQDIAIQIIINAIKLNKLPNAYLLTGIRGVGKTTTSYLVASELGYEIMEMNASDTRSKKKLDKDVFRRNLGSLLKAYEEVASRLGIVH